MPEAINNPAVPCSEMIPGGMFPGRIITVKGSIPSNARKFGIDLQYNNDIAFHFKPRFQEGYIVRNHYISGRWGQEETHGGLPLRRGETFEAHFICHYDRFTVLLNGQHFCDFKHRVPFHRISHITISYDVTIQLIDFEGIPPPLEYIPGKPHSSEEICGPY